METLRSNRIDLAQVIKSNRIRMLEVADIASVITRIGTLIGRQSRSTRSRVAVIKVIAGRARRAKPVMLRALVAACSALS